MRNKDTKSHKRIRPYPKVANYLLNKYALDQATSEYDAAIFCYMLQAKLNSQQYANDLTAKSCKEAEVYDKECLNDVLIERSTHLSTIFSINAERRIQKWIQPMLHFENTYSCASKKALTTPRTTAKIATIRAKVLTETIATIAMQQT